METKPTQRERQLETRVVKLEFEVKDLEGQIEALRDQLTMLVEHVRRLDLPVTKPAA